MKNVIFILLLNLLASSAIAQEPVYKQVDEYIKNMKGERPVNGADDKELTLLSFSTKSNPVIDGVVEPIWEEAKEIVAWDAIAKRNVRIKSLYSKDRIFFLVRFWDVTQNDTHKSWVWDKSEEMYVEGPDREDSFVFKWAMDTANQDLSVYSDQPYKADIWFWKAARTNILGYADDKYHVLDPEPKRKTTKLMSRSGKIMYLARHGDEGDAVYKSKFPVEYTYDKILKYTYRQPSRSRADVRAKGIWKNSEWVIEFSRAMKTNNDDDISFDPAKEYLFGISLYEIAAKLLGHGSDQPLYGCGDVNNRIKLKFN